jgi:hypothetical protein
MPFRFVLLRRSPTLQLGLFCLGLFHLGLFCFGLFCPPFFSHVIAPAFIQAMQDYTIRIRAISTTTVRLLETCRDYQFVLVRLEDTASLSASKAIARGSVRPALSWRRIESWMRKDTSGRARF